MIDYFSNLIMQDLDAKNTSHVIVICGEYSFVCMFM